MLHPHSFVGICDLSVYDRVPSRIHRPHHPAHCEREREREREGVTHTISLCLSLSLTHTHTHTQTHTLTHRHIHTLTHTQAHAHTHTHTGTYTHSHTHRHIHTLTHTQARTHTHTHTQHTHSHTHRHIHTPAYMANPKLSPRKRVMRKMAAKLSDLPLATLPSVILAVTSLYSCNVNILQCNSSIRTVELLHKDSGTPL